MESDFWLGIDLGTMFTAAAVHRQGRTEIVELGEHRAVLPSVVHISAWGELTVGDAAERRAATDPQGVVRAFKARLGDEVGCLVRDQMWSAEALLAVLLQHVTNLVSSKMGAPPRSVALSYPPSWGCYKQERLRDAARLAKLGEVHLVAEPLAVALRHSEAAQQERRGSGFGATPSLVLDLGGRSGSVTMVRFEPSRGDSPGEVRAGQASGALVPIMGTVEGIEVGGADFDESMRGVVEQLIGRPFDSFDERDPVVASGLAQLCVGLVSAKEQLSEQTSVELALPPADLPPSVRVTRTELEQAIRPQIAETVDAARRVQLSEGALEPELARMGPGSFTGGGFITGFSTGMSMSADWDERTGGDTLVAVDRSTTTLIGRGHTAPRQIVLAGGSARVPLLSRMLAHELGLPVVMDADPKGAVACGAALVAATRGSTQVLSATRTGSRPEPSVDEVVPPDGATSGLVPGPAHGAPSVVERSKPGLSAVRALSRRRVPPCRLGLLAAALLAGLGLVGGGLALRPGGGLPTVAGADATPAVARYASPVMQFADGFVEARQWALHVAEQRLVGTVTVTNSGSTPGSRRVEEIFPSTLVEDLGAVDFTPAPDRLDALNLSVSYDVNDLAPGASESFSYGLAVSVDAEEAQHRLAQWGRDRDRLAAVRTTEPAVSLKSLGFERTTVELDEGSVVPVTLSGVLTDGRPADHTMLAGIALVSSEPSVARASTNLSGSVELHGRRAGRSVVVAQSGSVRASLAVGVRKAAPAGTVDSVAPGSGAGTTSDQPRQAASSGSGALSASRASAGASSTESTSGSTTSSNATGQPASRAPVGRTGVSAAPPATASPAPVTSTAPTTTTGSNAGDLPPADVPTTTAPPITGPPPTDPPATTTIPPATTTTTVTTTTAPPADPTTTTTTTTTAAPPVDPPAPDPPTTTAPPADPPPDPAPVPLP